MNTATRPLTKRSRDATHKHIVSDAQALGVHRIHLLLVVQGKRTSPKLLARYNELVAARKAADPHHRARAIVDAGVAIAKALLPRFKEAKDDGERAVVCGELARQLPDGFDDAFDSIKLVMTVREIVRFQAAFVPFFTLFPAPPQKPGEPIRVKLRRA